MKKIEVVAAIIIKDNKVFATQRGYGEFKSMWEFPGGKIEDGENHSEALKREIKEELNTEVLVEKFIKTIDYVYPNFRLIMHCYSCSIESGDLELLEHEASMWVDKVSMTDLDWLPADVEVLPEVIDLLC